MTDYMLHFIYIVVLLSFWGENILAQGNQKKTPKLEGIAEIRGGSIVLEPSDMVDKERIYRFNRVIPKDFFEYSRKRAGEGLSLYDYACFKDNKGKTFSVMSFKPETCYVNNNKRITTHEPFLSMDSKYLLVVNTQSITYRDTSKIKALPPGAIKYHAGIDVLSSELVVYTALGNALCKVKANGAIESINDALIVSQVKAILFIETCYTCEHLQNKALHIYDFTGKRIKRIPKSGYCDIDFPITSPSGKYFATNYSVNGEDRTVLCNLKKRKIYILCELIGIVSIEDNGEVETTVPGDMKYRELNIDSL